MAKAQTTHETETVSFPDFTKAPDFAKMQAEFGKWFGDYAKAFNGKTGMVDFDAIFAAQRKNFETLTAANQVAFEGVKAVAQRQAEIARKAVEEFSKVAKEFAEPASAEEKLVKQAEIAKAGFEQVVANIREITDLVQKSNTEVAGLIQGRVAAQLDEVKAAITKVAKK
ncbi:phasin family protein [Dongia mobilis]|uniref:Phasin family protein n=1 Tax=Dongia mobilis TaxID=578943 RepID=A0A4R6WTN1_9PROT|nr:TIGR01841 family phasin [Dongia mobilis]TDQ82464.1 phasin family protein [Dongia mobilis]